MWKRHHYLISTTSKRSPTLSITPMCCPPRCVVWRVAGGWDWFSSWQGHRVVVVRGVGGEGGAWGAGRKSPICSQVGRQLLLPRGAEVRPPSPTPSAQARPNVTARWDIYPGRRAAEWPLRAGAAGRAWSWGPRGSHPGPTRFGRVHIHTPHCSGLQSGDRGDPSHAPPPPRPHGPQAPDTNPAAPESHGDHPGP